MSCTLGKVRRKSSMTRYCHLGCKCASISSMISTPSPSRGSSSVYWFAMARRRAKSDTRAIIPLYPSESWSNSRSKDSPDVEVSVMTKRLGLDSKRGSKQWRSAWKNTCSMALRTASSSLLTYPLVLRCSRSSEASSSLNHSKKASKSKLGCNELM